MDLLYRIMDKFRREFWRLRHPQIWGRNLQVNGIPIITGYKKLLLGKNVSVNDDVFLQTTGYVKIGDNVTISRGCTILTTGLDTSDYIAGCKEKLRPHIVKDVYIGKGAWLAANVIVTPGAYIPEGAIIAAGSIVVGRLEEKYAIYVGGPAVLKKKLNA